ncbi:MAG: polyprenyl synthetase family protein [Trueperaceae bacterium]
MPMPPDPLDPAWNERLTEAMLAVLGRASDGPHPDLDRFVELQRDYPRRGGKHLRGRLVLAATAAFGGDPSDAVPVAAALELFQNWVLVHDDVEDDSEERRGAPALHRQVGIPLAVNVGDAMHVAMWRLLIDSDRPWRDAVLREFLTTIRTTAEGQHLDLSWVHEGRFGVGRDAYLGMVDRKTATYTVVAPLRLGAWIAGGEPPPTLTPAGLARGRAFQVRDDVLNLLPDAGGGYGKEFAGDLYEGKRTLVLAIAFERLTPGDADRLRTVLDHPRDRIGRERVEEALRLIRSCGAIEEAQRFAEHSAEQGLERLREALRDAPGRDAVAAIERLVEDLASRAR